VKRNQWEAILNYVRMGKQMAASHDAAFVLVAVGEVEGNASPLTTWGFSGIESSSCGRSEVTIAALQHAVEGLTREHEERFGKPPRALKFGGKIR
jgi:hypothetical protein